jgi:hypothetical protein
MFLCFLIYSCSVNRGLSFHQSVNRGLRFYPKSGSKLTNYQIRVGVVDNVFFVILVAVVDVFMFLDLFM